MRVMEMIGKLSVAIRGERGSYNCGADAVLGPAECSYPG